MEQNNTDKSYPNLERIGNKDGNTVPDNYFDTLANRIGSRVGIQDIDALPDGYFEDLPSRVIEQSKPQEAKVVAFPYMRYAMGIAAMFVLFMAVNSEISKDDKIDIEESMSYVADIDTEEALDYLSTYDDIDLYQLVDEEMNILDEPISDENEDLYLEEVLEELSLEQLDELL